MVLVMRTRLMMNDGGRDADDDHGGGDDEDVVDYTGAACVAPFACAGAHGLPCADPRRTLI